MPEKFLHLHPTTSLRSLMPQPRVLLRLQGEEGDRAGNPYPGILGPLCLPQYVLWPTTAQTPPSAAFIHPSHNSTHKKASLWANSRTYAHRQVHLDVYNYIYAEKMK